jgi:hypothetical protein
MLVKKQSIWQKEGLQVPKAPAKSKKYYNLYRISERKTSSTLNIEH